MDYKEQWSVYDTNVQSYRANFISSQSLLLAVGALFVSENIFLEIFVAVIAFVQMWYIWFPVIRARAIISDFHKFNFKYSMSEKINIKGEKEDHSKTPLTEEEYVKNSKVRKDANNNLAEITGKPKLKRNFRITRVKLDILLPITFSLIWISMCVYSIVNA